MKNKFFKKATAGTLTVAMLFGLLPNVPATVKAEEAPKRSGGVKSLNLNIKQSDGSYQTAGINNPQNPADENSAWNGTKVYFGQYNGTPLLFRVLDKDTTDYSQSNEHTMFLDCDSVPEKVKFDNDYTANAGATYASEWEYSDLKNWLNSDEKEKNHTNSDGKQISGMLSDFNETEKNAIAFSTRETELSVEGLSPDEQSILPWCPLKDTKMFALDLREATNPTYGYSASNGEIKNRIKSDAAKAVAWWLRSPIQEHYPENVGKVYEDGIIGNNTVDDGSVGASPAFNLHLSSVLFSSANDMKKDSENLAAIETVSADTNVWKLTLLDENKSVTLQDGQKLIQHGRSITVPYTYTGNDISQISVMITNGDYQSAETEVLYYGKLNTTDNFANGSGSGTGTFVLPNELPDTYVIYFLAEDVNPNYYTDYASTPFKVEYIEVHTTEQIPAKEATCTEVGNIAYWHCQNTDCGKYFADEDLTKEITLEETKIPLAEHQFSSWWDFDKENHWKKCYDCGEKKDEAKHTEDSGAVTKQPTKDSAGERTYRCIDCHYTMRTEEFKGEQTAPPKPEIKTHTKDSITLKEIPANSVNGGAISPKYSKDGGENWQDSPTFDGLQGNTEYKFVAYYPETVGYNASEKSEVLTSSIPHEMEHHKQEDSTCTTTGTKEYWHCEICGTDYADKNGTTELTEKEISATGHTVKAIPAKEATCTEMGNTAYWYCEKCNKYFSDEEMTTEISYEETVIPITKHQYGEDWKTDNKNHWKECFVCGVKKDEAKHTEDSGTVTKQPTKDSAGERTYRCIDCIYLIRTEEYKSAQTAPSKPEIETHTKDSITLKEISANSVNGGAISPKYSKDGGENWQDSPTFDELQSGMTYKFVAYYPETVGYNASEKSDVLQTVIPHEMQYHKQEDSTCTTTGTKEYWHCKVCGTDYADENGTTELTEKEISATGHTAKAIAAKEATCTEVGNKEYWYCETCKKYFSDEKMTTEIAYENTILPITEHQYGEDWKSDDKNHWKECSVCGEKKDEAKHTEDSGTVTVQPTGQSAGEKTYYCTVCGHKIRTEVLPILTPSKPNEPSESSEPSKPSEPTQPNEPEKPTNPNKPNETEKPNKPKELKPTGREPIKSELVKPITAKKNTNTIYWTKVSGANGYLIYGAPCNTPSHKNKMKLVGKTSAKTTKFTHKNLKKNVWYKYRVYAYKEVNGEKKIFAQSLDLHSLTTGGTKYANPKAVQVNKSNFKLKKGKTAKVKASIVMSKGKKLKHHTDKIRYLVSDKKIATINKNGVIKSKKKGTCTIYAVAQNGVSKKIKVTVK